MQLGEGSSAEEFRQLGFEADDHLERCGDGGQTALGKDDPFG